jgi:hypothetical protein
LALEVHASPLLPSVGAFPNHDDPEVEEKRNDAKDGNADLLTMIKGITMVTITKDAAAAGAVPMMESDHLHDNPTCGCLLWRATSPSSSGEVVGTRVDPRGAELTAEAHNCPTACATCDIGEART